MEQFLVYATTVILGGLLFGLLFYSFYIVLTSNKDKTGAGKTSPETGGSKEVITSKTGQKQNPSGQPGKKTPKNKKGTQKAA